MVKDKSELNSSASVVCWNMHVKIIYKQIGENTRTYKTLHFGD